MKQVSSESTFFSHRSRTRRLTTEDFILLVIHSDRQRQEELVQIMKSGDFTTYADSGIKGAIGSALMFTPNAIIFDLENDAETFKKTYEFIRNDKLAKHISHMAFILIHSKEASKQVIPELQSDPHVVFILLDSEDINDNLNQLKRQIFQLYRQAQKELNKQDVTPEVAASRQQQTASMNELLMQHRNFDEAVIRTFEMLIKKVASGDPQKIFDIIAKTFELLNRPFIIQYIGSDNKVYQHTEAHERNMGKIKALLSETIKLNNVDQSLNKLNSDQDRRCFFGQDRKFYFATESPIVFDELDNLSMVTKNFEMFLLQADRRRTQMGMMGRFRELFEQVYASMEGFEWSESLEEMNDIVNEMFTMDEIDEEDQDDGVSGELELF